MWFKFWKFTSHLICSLYGIGNKMKTEKKTPTLFAPEFQFWEMLCLIWVIQLFIFNRENIYTVILVRGWGYAAFIFKVKVIIFSLKVKVELYHRRSLEAYIMLVFHKHISLVITGVFIYTYYKVLFYRVYIYILMAHLTLTSFSFAFWACP